MNKKSLIKKVIIISIPIYIIFGLGYSPSFFGKLMHFKYIFSHPDDYFTKLVDDDFDFYTTGYSKTYKLDYKYFSLYSIAMIDENKKLPYRLNGELYVFKGKIKADFFSNNKIIKTEYITDWERGFFVKNSIRFINSYILKYFTIPIANQYKDLSVKLTVIEPMKYYNPNNKLKISINATLKE